MQQGYWYTANRQFDASKMPNRSALTAAKRALRRLGARKIKTTRVPVVFDPRNGGGPAAFAGGRGLGTFAL